MDKLRQGVTKIFPAKAASIGVIGGADGPTAIYVTGWPMLETVLCALFVLAVVGVLLWQRRRRK